MKKMQQVIELLKQENINATIKTSTIKNEAWNEIVWASASGDECSINETNIAEHMHQIAWFQSDYDSNHLLCISENGAIFKWEPKTYNPVFGCYCLLIEWYKDHLIFIYQEKHDIYICSIKDQKVNYFNFNGEEIERKGDLISYETYNGKTPEKIKLIQLPELIHREPIDKAEAERRDLIPSGLNRPDNFLSHDFGR